MRTRSAIVGVLAGLLLASCGTDTPSTTVAEEPTSTTVAEEPTSTTAAEGVTTPTTVVEEPPTETTSTTAAEEVTTSTTVVEEVTTPTTVVEELPTETTSTTVAEELPTETIRVSAGDLNPDPVPEHEVPADAFFVDTVQGVDVPGAYLTPVTAEQVLGWTQPERGADSDGSGIHFRLDGWRVEHFQTDDGPEATVSLSVTLLGAFTGPDRELFETSNPTPPVVVEFRTEDTGTHVFVEDPPILREPVRSGEERPMTFSWDLPVDAYYLQVRVADAVFYVLFPHDPGQWGKEPSEGGAETVLAPPCFRQSDCSEMGFSLEYRALSLAPGFRDGYVFQAAEFPVPTDRSELDADDVSVWYESSPDTVWHPANDDPWRNWTERGRALIAFAVPPRSDYLYVQWKHPDGQVVLFKTTAPLRDRLFSNPDWVWTNSQWGEPEHLWAEDMAVIAADRICWSIWTNASGTPGHFSRPIYSADRTETFDITPDMITWVVNNLCGP